MVDKRSWVHVLSVLSRSCVWEIDVWVLPAYWNHVLWSDETKINLFDSDGVKRVWRQPGEEYKDKCVLPTVKYGGGSVMVWGCMSAAGTGELQFIEGTMNIL